MQRVLVHAKKSVFFLDEDYTIVRTPLDAPLYLQVSQGSWGKRMLEARLSGDGRTYERWWEWKEPIVERMLAEANQQTKHHPPALYDDE